MAMVATSQKSRMRASSRSAFGCHHASGSFICREPFSVYSRGMATMATMATPKLKVEKKMKGKEVG